MPAAATALNASHPNAPGNPRRLLRAVLRAVRRDLALCIAAGLCWQAVAIAIPWALERAIDDGVLAGNQRAIWGWAAVVAAFGVIRWLGDAARHWWVERAGAGAAYWLRRRLVDRLLAMNDDELSRFGHGDLTARALSDTEKVWMWLSGLATYVTAAGTVAVVLLLLATVDLPLAAIGLATVPFAVVFALRQVGTHNRLADAVAHDTGSYTGTVDAALAGIRAVKGLGAEPAMTRQAADASHRLEQRAICLSDAEAWWLAGAGAIPAAGLAAGLWTGGHRALDGHITVGSLVAFAGWMALLVDATTTLTDRLTARGAALAAASRLGELLDQPPERPPTIDASLPPSVHGPADLTVDGLTVGHRGRVVLRSVDLDVPAGGWLALIGPTGGGKTSLLRALAGLDVPLLGTVRVGGTDLHSLTRADRQPFIAYLPQNPLLVSGALGTIIRLAAPYATDADIVAAVTAAAANDILDQLGSLDAPIGDRGLTLSGGQRQRLALAAAIVRRPPILLLDDSTSALDTTTELRVLEGLRKHLPDTTVVLATHRPAPARRCGQVLFIADGGAVHVDDAQQAAFLQERANHEGAP